MVDLDRARRGDLQRGSDDIPLAFEAVELKPPLVRGGWVAVTVLVIAAIAMAFRYSSGVGEAAGGLLAAVAVLLAFVLVRCRRFETTVGTVQLEAKVGLLDRKLPLGLVTGVALAPATSWRKAYADREIRVEVAGDAVALPTREPEELLAALPTPREGGGG